MKSNISCPDIRREAGQLEPPPPSVGMEIVVVDIFETHLMRQATIFNHEIYKYVSSTLRNVVA